MKKVILPLAAMLACASVSAQEHMEAPYWFVGASGGAAMSMTPDFRKVNDKAPSASLSVGYMFAPEAGLRLGINKAFKSNGLDYTIIDTHTHRLSYTTVNLDFMPNLCTTFGDNEYYPLNLYLILGLGYDAMTESDSSNKEGVAVAGNKHGYTNKDLSDQMNLRAGFMLEYNVAKHVGITLETAVNSSRIWTVELGLNYKFGKRKPKTIVYNYAEAPTTTAAEQAAVAAAQQAEAEAKARQAEAEKARRVELERKRAEEARVVAEKAEREATAVKATAKENISKSVFFTIGKSNARKKSQVQIINEIVSWMKSHENSTAVITGYADKGTGSADVNKAISEKRAIDVANKIKAKGIAADRIIIDSKGDTIQPYDDNDSNRVAIIEAREN